MIIRYRCQVIAALGCSLKELVTSKLIIAKGSILRTTRQYTDRLRTLLQTGSAICLRLFAFVKIMRIGQYKIAQFRQFVTVIKEELYT